VNGVLFANIVRLDDKETSSVTGFFGQRKTYVSAILGAALVVAGCSSGAESSPEATFAKELIGTYERVAPVPAPDGSTAYLRQIVAVSASDSPNTVTQTLTTEAFFDEELTQAVLKYDSVGPCVIVQPSSIPGGFEVDCTNDSSTLTAFVTEPALLEGLGIDDCNLTAGEPADVSNGCAAPTFVVSNCVDMDVFALSEDGANFSWGDQTQNRCERRSTELEPESFQRVTS